MNDFTHDTAEKNLPECAGRNFEDKLSLAIEGKGTSETVERNAQLDSLVLVVKGEITRYVEDDSVFRTLIGFGAGCTYFDAVVNLVDNQIKETLGQIEADKTVGLWVVLLRDLKQWIALSMKWLLQLQKLFLKAL